MLFTKISERAEVEAATLRRAQHSGVVELADVDVDRGVIRTRWVEGRSLETVGRLAPEELAGVAAAIAATLADLHERGLHHGGLEAGHVLITGEGQAVLCSLGRVGQATDDVAAWGRLVSELLETGTEQGDVRDLGSGLRRRDGLGTMLAPSALATLAELAAAASAPVGDGRPEAADLAAAIRERVPACRLPRARPARLLAPDPPRPAGVGRRAGEARRPSVLVATVVVAAVLAAAALAVTLGGTVAGGRDRSSATARSTTSTIRTVATAATGSTTTTAAPTAAPARPLAADSATTTAEPSAERVWPRESLDFRDGVLSVGRVRYEIGTDGDVVVRGEWGCRPDATLALLRPATGQVYAFDEWAGPGHDVVGRSVGAFPGATDLRIGDVDGDGCPDLQAVSPMAAPRTVSMMETER